MTTAERPYRSATSVSDALEELELHAGTQFEPAVVEAFTGVFRQQVASSEAAWSEPAFQLFTSSEPDRHQGRC